MNNKMFKKLNFIMATLVLIMSANLCTVFANSTNNITNTVKSINETKKFDISKSGITIESMNNFVLVNYDNGESYLLNPDQCIEIFQSDPSKPTDNVISIEYAGSKENPIKLNLKNINIQTDTDNIPLHVTNNSNVIISLDDDSTNRLNTTFPYIPALMVDPCSTAIIHSNIENQANLNIGGVSEAICNLGKLELHCKAEITSGKSNCSAGICNNCGELYIENAKINISSHIYGIYNDSGHIAIGSNSYTSIKAYHGIFNSGSTLNFCDDAILEISRSTEGISNINESVFNLYSGEIHVTASDFAIKNIDSTSNVRGGMLYCKAYGSDVNASGIYLKRSKLKITDGIVNSVSSQSGINAVSSSKINVKGGTLFSTGSILGFGIKLSKDSTLTERKKNMNQISGGISDIFQ